MTFRSFVVFLAGLVAMANNCLGQGDCSSSSEVAASNLVKSELGNRRQSPEETRVFPHSFLAALKVLGKPECAAAAELPISYLGVKQKRPDVSRGIQKLRWAGHDYPAAETLRSMGISALPYVIRRYGDPELVGKARENAFAVMLAWFSERSHSELIKILAAASRGQEDAVAARLLWEGAQKAASLCHPELMADCQRTMSEAGR